VVHLGRQVSPQTLGPLADDGEPRGFGVCDEMLPYSFERLLPHLLVHGLLLIRLQVLLDQVLVVGVAAATQAYIFASKLAARRVNVDGYQTILGVVVVNDLHDLFGLVPEVLLARELGQVLELELHAGRLGRRRRAHVGVRGNALILGEVDAGVWNPGSGLKSSQQPVAEVPGLFKVEVLARHARIIVLQRRHVRKLGGEVMRRQQPSKHSYRRFEGVDVLILIPSQGLGDPFSSAM